MSSTNPPPPPPPVTLAPGHTLNCPGQSASVDVVGTGSATVDIDGSTLTLTDVYSRMDGPLGTITNHGPQSVIVTFS